MLGAFSPSSNRLLAGRFELDWTKYWLVLVALGGGLAGLFAAYFLYSFSPIHLLALAGAVLVGAWIFFRPGSLPFFLLFCFVAAACPYLKLGGAMDIVRWVALAGATYYLGLELLRRRLPLRLRAEHFPIVLFCAWALASTAYSPLPLLTFLKAGAFSVLILFCFLFAERSTPADPARPTREFFRALVLLNAVFIPASFLVRLAGLEIHGHRNPGADPTAMYGLFGNPNSLGLFAALMLPLLLWSRQEYPRWRLPLNLLFAANLFAVFASRSRASYGTAFVGVMFFLLLRKPKWLLVCLLIGAMVGGVYLAYAPEEINRFSYQYIYKTRESILASRLDHWRHSLDYIEQRWLLGYGYAVSPGAPADWDFSASTGAVARERGSAYLAIWEETGLIGLLLLCALPLWVALRSIRKLHRTFRLGTQEKSRLLVLASLLLAALANALFEDWMIAPGFFAAVFFWLLTFLLARELKAEHQRRQALSKQ